MTTPPAQPVLPFADWPRRIEPGTLSGVASGQRRKGKKSMSRRRGPSGQVVRKGNHWHVRFYVDVPGQEERKRKSVAVGPATGKEKLTKSEAARKGAEIIAALGVNTAEHLRKAQHPSAIETFADRVRWCRKNRRAWTDGKPGPIATMEGHLAKHILPRFGDRSVADITEREAQEWIAELKRTTFERRRKNGELIKRYRLSRKTVLNLVGVLKLVVGRRTWIAWELDVGRPVRSKQRYFTEAQLQQIIEAATGQDRVLFALLAGTGLRIGEAAGLHLDDLDLDNGAVYVRRTVWRGRDQSPKTENAVRVVDIDGGLAALLRQFIGERTEGRLFRSRNGTPIAGENIRKRVLLPLLERLGIQRAGMHAFRHSRVTMLRKRGTPDDLQRQWIGHSSLRTTDRYSHTDEDLEFRREAASRAGLGTLLDPISAVGPNSEGPKQKGELKLRPAS